MTKTFKITILVFGLILYGCKSTKRISSSGDLNIGLSSKQIIKQHQKQGLKFKTLQSKVKVEYIQGEKSQTHTINLRIEKDKVIWISATLGIVRAKITPEKVSFYNKLDNTYFDGDFKLISNLLGTDLNYENVQNMLLGQALFNLEEQSYTADTSDKSYVLSPKDQNALYEIFFLLNPKHFKMDSQQLSQPLKRRILQIDYKNYQDVEKQAFPENMIIIAVENDEETIINMEFKSVTLNGDLRFPFRIPSGYDEIEIK